MLTLERLKLGPEIKLNPKALIMREGQAVVTVLRLNGSGDFLLGNSRDVVNGIRDAIEHGLGKKIKIPRNALKQALWSNENGDFSEDGLVRALISPAVPSDDEVYAAEVVNFFMNERTFRAAVVDTNTYIIYDDPKKLLDLG